MSDPRRAVEEAFTAFTVAWVAGERPDPEEFCRRHPEAGAELRARIKDFLFVAEGVREVPERPGGEEGGIAGGPAGQAGTILGDFRVLREIGRGGMGVVYEAEQVSLKRKVALKVLPAHLGISERAVRKFRREARAGGRQKHENIVAVYAVGEHEGIHYIAQEYVEDGRSLDDRIEEFREEGELPRGYFRETARIVAETARALEHAHGAGVIHRDVKPSNILVTPEGRPKLSDFGLAWFEDSADLTLTKGFAGTPYYMAPEQAEGRKEEIDARTDVFSLGATMYEMLTLRRPFAGETTPEVVRKILLKDPKKPLKVNARVPRDLSIICLKALEKEPGHRYRSMAAFAEDLERFLSGDVILARPTGPLGRLFKLVRRNPVQCGAWLAAAAAIAVALFFLFFYDFDKAFLDSLESRIENEAGDEAALEAELAGLGERKSKLSIEWADRIGRLEARLKDAIQHARGKPALDCLAALEARRDSLRDDPEGCRAALAEMARVRHLVPDSEGKRADSLWAMFKDRIALEEAKPFLAAFLAAPEEPASVTAALLGHMFYYGEGSPYEEAFEKLKRIAAVEEAAVDVEAEKKLLAERGFSFKGEETHSFGGAAKRVRVYRHEAAVLDFVRIPGGVFWMGSPVVTEGQISKEWPVHAVRVKPFLFCRTECTQSAWRRGGGEEVSSFGGRAECPVEKVNWVTADAWCRRAGLRLPSEAEWEYAYRAGTRTAFFFGDDPSRLEEYAFYIKTARGSPGMVGNTNFPRGKGKLKPNAFGLYNMAGNVKEWCLDRFNGNYEGAPVDGSPWLDERSSPFPEGDGPRRVIRGGCWNEPPNRCRAAVRGGALEGHTCETLGFRPAADIPSEAAPR